MQTKLLQIGCIYTGEVAIRARERSIDPELFVRARAIILKKMGYIGVLSLN